MDADTIRLILIVAGAILLLGLYLWERSRDSEEDDGEDEGYDDEDAPYGAPPPRSTREKHEPGLGRIEDADKVRGRGSDDWDRQFTGGPASPADSYEDPDSGEPSPLLIQLSVARRQGELRGPDLLEISETCGLRPGDMDIFHCLDEFDDGTRIYFSMANMVKPGTFPFDDMETFSTPGVMLFARLNGDPEDLTILEEMIATARKIATTLGCDVLDETRRPLTVRKEEDLRKAVLANEARFARRARF
jgi:cell division protein ZipA